MLILRENSLFKKKIYGLILPRDQIKNVNEKFIKQFSQFTFTDNLTKLHFKYQNNKIGKIINYSKENRSIEYKYNLININKDLTDNITINKYAENHNIIYTLNEKTQYYYKLLFDFILEGYLTESIKNHILIDDHNNNLFESLKLDKNLIIIAFKTPIKNFDAFYLGVSIFI